MLERLNKICKNVKVNELMSEHTTFKIGGPADFYLEPQNVDEIKDIISLCKSENVPYLVTGNGSNMLVSDNGIEGVVINIGDAFSNMTADGTKLVAGAGVLLSKLSKFALKNELSGLEFASGIPGTLGGALYMNAGAYGGEMKDVVNSVTFIDEDGNIKTETELGFGYRKSIFTDKSCVILSCEMELEKGNAEDIKDMMADLTQRRVTKQPIEMPSAGSVFKRPEGHFAGGLIEDAGLKGYSIGGAIVSPKHAGFIVNKGGATAKDVTDLIKYIIKTVEDKFNVTLEPEVKLIGRK